MADVFWITGLGALMFIAMSHFYFLGYQRAMAFIEDLFTDAEKRANLAAARSQGSLTKEQRALLFVEGLEGAMTASRERLKNKRR